MLASVTTHSLFSKSILMSVAVSEVGVNVLCGDWSKMSMDSIGGISYYVDKCYNCYQTSSWRQYLPFSNTAHGACNTAQV